MDKLIKYIVIMLLALGLGFHTLAQGGRPPAFVDKGGYKMRNPPNAGKRFELIHTEYLKQQLKLSPAESEKFWPVYEQYESDVKEVNQARRLNNRTPQPDAAKEFSYEQKLLNIRQHYHEEFLKILSVEKVNLLYKSESDFKYELLRHLREGKDKEEN